MFSETFIDRKIDMYQDLEARQQGILRFSEEWKAWMVSADLILGGGFKTAGICADAEKGVVTSATADICSIAERRASNVVMCSALDMTSCFTINGCNQFPWVSL